MSAPRKPKLKKRYYTRLMDLYRYSPVRIGLLNPVIRGVFRWRANAAVHRIVSTSIPDDEVRAWYEARRLFFCVAVPRSGSMFLADLLNQAAGDIVVTHEPNVFDYYFYHRAMQEPESAHEYISQYRRLEMMDRLRHHSCRMYGEVNPFLRRHCAALKSVLPDAPLLHLVRDGRAVVRSLLSREQYAVNDPMAPLNRPPTEDPFAERWPKMSRFERLCWLWQADNRYIRQYADHTAQFEDVVGSYGYFAERILQPLGLTMTEETWRACTRESSNATPRYRAPVFSDWPPDWRATFARICGEEMEACGYRL